MYKYKIKNLGLCVCSGAKAKCSFGEKEVDLSALPLPLTPKDEGNAQLSVMDFIPFLNIPAFLTFIPITMLMARLGARSVHKIEKKYISKLFGVFLLIIASKFLYEYLTFN